MRLCIHGAMGRMGQRLLALASADPAFTVTGAVEYDGHPQLGQPVGVALGLTDVDVPLTADVAAAVENADAVISFALPEGSAACVQAAAQAGIPCIVGTTGFTAEQEAALTAAADTCVLVAAPNFAVGVNVLLKTAEEVARRLGEDFDIEVVEMHHNQKVDAPSGTAMRLAEGVARATDRSIADVGVYGRQGHVGKRTPREIGVLALRGGDVVGEHTVVFAGTGERLELTHRAGSRDLFANGALRAAKWAAAQSPGRYDMFDVLGLD